MPPTGDATDLLASVGDPDRFAVVFERHFDAVHAYLARRSTRDAADELAAEVFCIAFERRASFDPTHDDARPWLFGIAARLLLRRARTGSRRDRAHGRLRVAPAPPASEVGDRLAGDEAAADVARAMASLPDADRETLQLLAWERLTYEQIAQSLGIPVGTVRSRIARARQRMRHLLATTDDAPASPITGGRT